MTSSQTSALDAAIRDAARAVNAHIGKPDTVTFHDMQAKVQGALDLGANLKDIRDARPAV